MKNIVVVDGSLKKIPSSQRKRILEVLASAPVNIVSKNDRCFPTVLLYEKRSRVNCSYNAHVTGQIENMVLEEENERGGKYETVYCRQPEYDCEGKISASILLKIKRRKFVRAYHFNIGSS